MSKSHIVTWSALIEAESKEEAAELAAAILFDQSQEIITLKVFQDEITVHQGTAIEKSDYSIKN